MATQCAVVICLQTIRMFYCTWQFSPPWSFSIWCLIFRIVTGGNPDAKRLYDDLLSNYNKLVRPVVNVSDALTVRIKLKLSQLIDVNLKNQIMTTNLWVEQSVSRFNIMHVFYCFSNRWFFYRIILIQSSLLIHLFLLTHFHGSSGLTIN